MLSLRFGLLLATLLLAPSAAATDVPGPALLPAQTTTADASPAPVPAPLPPETWSSNRKAPAPAQQDEDSVAAGAFPAYGGVAAAALLAVATVLAVRLQAAGPVPGFRSPRATPAGAPAGAPASLSPFRAPLMSTPPPSSDPADGLDAEDCMRIVTRHIEGECFDRALEWTERARARAPTSARVHGTRGFVLEMLGRHVEALDAYATASRLAPEDGQHDLEAARLALRVLKDAERAEMLVERALHRSPDLVVDVEEDPLLGTLIGRPAYDMHVERAWARHVRALSRDE